MIFGKKRRLAAPVLTAPRDSFRWEDHLSAGSAMERRLYQSLRESVPLIDAALYRIERLIGGFSVECPQQEAQQGLQSFLRSVRVNAGQCGMDSFLTGYLDQLLTFGSAVGEIVPTADGGEIFALYNASLDGVEICRGDNPLEAVIRRKEAGGSVPVEYPERILFTAFNPPPGEILGTSILRGLPFVSRILLTIFKTIGTNWERVGNVRFAVTYKPGSEGERAFGRERAQQIAAEWSRAMQEGPGVSDFVSVGDVSVKVIGADNQILDSEIPVRQMMEQMVAKLGVPPFLLGLSWSTTERMSAQQADLLTSELEDYRRILQPALARICAYWLGIHGFSPEHRIVWDTISLRDEEELASARLANAQAEKIERELEGM